VPNKITRDLKEMILGALDGAGGVDYLIEQSQKNPAAFLTLVGKVLPLQMTGANDGPVMIVTGVTRAGEDSAGSAAPLYWETGGRVVQRVGDDGRC
jgi:hypothetical protein